MLGHGKYKEASKWFKKNKITKEYTREEYYQYKILECRVHTGLNDKVDVIPILDDIIKNATKENIPKQYLEAYIIKSSALEHVGLCWESLECANEGLKLLKKIPDKNTKDYQLIKAYLLGRKSTSYYQLNNANKAISFSKQAIRIFEIFNETSSVAFFLSILGISYINKENIPKALEYLYESLNLFLEVKNDYQCSIIYHYLSRVYGIKGEPNRALEYMNKSLPIIRSFGDDRRIAISLLHMIPILIERGDYTKAKKYSIQCLDLLKKAGIIAAIGMMYYNQIRIALFQEDIIEAKKNYDILVSLENVYQYPNYYIELRQFSEALILHKNGRLSDLARSEEILRQLLDTNSLTLKRNFEAMYYLCDILLQEYQASPNSDILHEINTLSKEILACGNKDELTGLRINAYNIRLLTLYVQEQNEAGSVDLKEVESLLKNSQELSEKLGSQSKTKEFEKQFFELVTQNEI